MADGGGNWTECVWFQDGVEVGCSDPEDEFFGKWETEIDGKKYSANLFARIDGEILRTQEDIEKTLARLGNASAPAGV